MIVTLAVFPLCLDAIVRDPIVLDAQLVAENHGIEPGHVIHRRLIESGMLLRIVHDAVILGQRDFAILSMRLE